MPRTSAPVRAPRVLAAAALVAVSTITLSGCFGFGAPDSAAPSPESSRSPEPTSTTGDQPVDGTTGPTLTFAQGSDLTTGDFVQWSDGFMTDEGWQIDTPDDGNGSWTYRTVDGACTVQFWQGTTAGTPVAESGDDSLASDELLALVLGSDAATVSPAAGTDAFSYQLSGTGAVENRFVTGDDGEHAWMLSARAFTALDAGLWQLIDCTGGDPGAVRSDVQDKSAVILMPAS